MPTTEDYLKAIREARDGGKRVRLDFGLLPEGVDREAVAKEVSGRLPADYGSAIRERYINQRGVELDFGKIKLEPTATELISKAVSEVAIPAARQLISLPGKAVGALTKAATTTAMAVIPPLEAFNEAELDLIRRPLLEKIRSLAPVEDFPRLGEEKSPEFGKGWIASRAILEAAVENLVPLTIEETIGAYGTGKGIGIGAGILVKRFPWLAKQIRIPPSLGRAISTQINTIIFRVKKGLGIHQETSLVPVDVREALAQDRLTPAQAARASEDVFRDELLKRILPEEMRSPAPETVAGVPSARAGIPPSEPAPTIRPPVSQALARLPQPEPKAPEVFAAKEIQPSPPSIGGIPENVKAQADAIMAEEAKARGVEITPAFKMELVTFYHDEINRLQVEYLQKKTPEAFQSIMKVAEEIDKKFKILSQAFPEETGLIPSKTRIEDVPSVESIIPPVEIQTPTPPPEASVKPPDFEIGQIVVAKDSRGIIKRIEAFGGPSDPVKVEDGWLDAQGNFQKSNNPEAVRELSLDSLRNNFEKFYPKATVPISKEAINAVFEPEIDHGPPLAPLSIDPKGKLKRVSIGGLDMKEVRTFLDEFKKFGLDVKSEDVAISGIGKRLRPERALKAKAAGLLDEAGNPTSAALAAARELRRIDDMMKDGFVDALDIFPQTRTNIQAVLKSAMDRGRFDFIKLAQNSGWLTDGTGMVRFPTADQKIVAEFSARIPKDTPEQDISRVIRNADKAKVPIENIIGIKKTAAGDIFLLLETSEGWRIIVDSKYWRLVNDQFPSAQWFAAGPENPLRAVVGGKTIAVVMPMRGKDRLISMSTGRPIPASGVVPSALTASSGGGGATKASKGPFAENTTVELGDIEHIKPLQMPEMVKLAKELMGHFPEISRRMGPETRGIFSPVGDGIIRLRPELFASPEQAAKTLAHEIGHLIDWLPDKYMQRGNLLGRMLVLRRYLKQSFGDQKVNNPELRSELIALGEYWRPYDKSTATPLFLAYRKKSEELYADAISVLFNSPGTLERMAPKFYRVFFENLDKKPEVKEAFLGLQNLINGKDPNILKSRQTDIREMFARGEDIFKLKNAERDMRHSRIWERLRQELDDINYPITSKIQKLEAGGVIVPDEMNPKFRLQEISLADNVNYLMMSQIDMEFMGPLEKAGISIEDAGEYVFLSRVLRDRANLANPLGHNPDTARLQIDFLRAGLGEEKFAILAKSVDNMHEIVFKSVDEAVRVGTYNKEIFETKIKPNKGNYASFSVLDYLEKTGHITAMVKEQRGTLREVANPLVATLMKTVALNRLNVLQRAKNSFRDSWRTFFPDEIRPSKVIRSGPGLSVFINSPGWGRVEMLENGKLVSYDVDPYIADAFKNTKSGDLNIIVDVLNSINRGIFHPLYITYNPGFALAFNPIRDFLRTYKAIPGANLKTLMVEYVRSLPVAYRRTAGIQDTEVEEMLKSFAIDVQFNDFNLDPRGDQYGEMLARYGLSADPGAKIASLKKTIAKPLVMLLEGLRFMGSALEVLPKIAGYRLRKRLGESGDILAHNTRNYTGTPNYRVKGLRTDTTNAIFMFSNIFKEGMKSDLQLALDPRTRGGYWWKTVKASILPKLFMRLAAVGVLGKELKDHYDRMTEYDKTNYIVFPVGKVEGKDGNWKSLYARIPHDESGRLAAAVFWKMSGAMQGRTDAWQQILAFGAGQLPSVSPAIDLSVTWGTFLTGKNPYDWFRGRPIIPETEFKAGGWPSLKKMVQWTTNEFGLTQFATYDPTGRTTFDTWANLTPVLNRVIKASDYGLRETQHEEVKMADKDAALRRLARGEMTRKFMLERWRMAEAKRAQALPANDLRRLARMDSFYNSNIRPIEHAAAKAEGRGEAAAAERLRKKMEELVMRFEQAR